MTNDGLHLIVELMFLGMSSKDHPVCHDEFMGDDPDVAALNQVERPRVHVYGFGYGPCPGKRMEIPFSLTDRFEVSGIVETHWDLRNRGHLPVDEEGGRAVHLQGWKVV